ncbi:MAG: aminomethyl transferase family protein [Desulfococcus multivorans]|jgi:aminomethyltransferase|nr:aminomethyl transferase family protein [Desulfococcus multivorans]
MGNHPKKTLLHGWHTAHGANMADFSGYEMPLWYASAKNEHLAVLTHAGAFDTSHMASLLVSGTGAFELLQKCFTNDMSACIGRDRKALFPGRCVYGAFLTEEGGVLDDAIIFHIALHQYMVVVNAGMGPHVADHLSIHAGEADVRISDLTDRLGKMDVQGPMAARVMKKILKSPDLIFDRMPYFSFKGYFDAASPQADTVRLIDGTPVLLSRTGYTGEFGFEIFIASEHFVKLWEMVIAAGKEFGLTACGLAARDSLRTGAVLPLSHQDIGPWPFINTPWSFALPYDPSGRGFTKAFIGDKALTAVTNPEFTYPFAGFDLRKVSLPAVVMDVDGMEIGTVLTCATDMGIGRHQDRIFSIVSPDRPEACRIKGLCCGFIKVKKPLKIGTVVTLKDVRRTIQIRVEKDIRPNRTARKPLKEML